MRCRITNHHHHALTDDFSQFYSVVVTHRPCKFSARSEESARAICDRSSIRNERGANARVNREREGKRERTAGNSKQHSTAQHNKNRTNRRQSRRTSGSHRISGEVKNLVVFRLFYILFSVQLFSSAVLCVCFSI